MQEAQKQKKAGDKASDQKQADEASPHNKDASQGVKGAAPKDPDPQGKALASTQDPLGEASKLVGTLREHAGDRLQTHLWAFKGVRIACGHSWVPVDSRAPRQVQACGSAEGSQPGQSCVNSVRRSIRISADHVAERACRTVEEITDTGHRTRLVDPPLRSKRAMHLRIHG